MNGRPSGVGEKRRRGQRNCCSCWYKWCNHYGDIMGLSKKSLAYYRAVCPMSVMAESLQHRINQCNRYQVLSIQLPIRSSLGLIYNSPHHHHMKNIKKLPLLAAPVVKKFNATIQHPPTTSHFIKSALGNTTYDPSSIPMKNYAHYKWQ